MPQDMVTLYQPQDVIDLSAQLRKRLTIWLALALALIGWLAYTLVVRLEWMTNLSFILLGALSIAFYGLFVDPIVAYRRHVRLCLTGRQREYIGVFLRFDDAPVLRDKVRYVPLWINTGDKGLEEDERLLYWDLNLPLPDWQPGMHLTTLSFDKAITAWSATRQ